MRAFRLGLLLLPRSFRDEYGRELAAAFERRAARAGSPRERIALVVRELAGLGREALRLHGELLAQDLRWASRALRRAPGFAFTAVGVAALGIGATTAVFSVADHVLVRPLPFAEPDRLLKLWRDERFRGYPRLEPSPADVRDWRERSRSFDAMASYWPTSATLTGDGEPERLQVAKVSAALGDVLRLRPALGRLFETADDLPGAPATAVLSHAFWRSRFGGDREILGRRLEVDGEAVVVVGVLPPGIDFPDRETRLWLPQRFDAGWYEDRDNNFLRVVARLRAGVSVEAARAELSAIAAQIAAEHPKPEGEPGIRAVALRDELSRESRLLLLALVAAALCLLALACTNLASLLLSRSLGRARELAVRAALGGGRARLVRQMLTESLLLAGSGGALGVLLARLATPALARLVPTALPISEAPAADGRLLVLAVLLTVATGVGFGLAPALRAPVDASAAELREGGRGGDGPRRQLWRRGLVGVEVALSLTLVVTAGLLVRALGRLEAVDPGFRSAGVLTLRTWLPRPEYDATERRHQFYARVLAETRALPGVAAAGYSSFLPLTMRGGIWEVKGLGAGGDAASASLRFVTPGFLEALQVPLRSGRLTGEGDTAESEKVAVVSESFARQFLPGRDPLGQRFEIAFFPRTVVGVVGDVAVRGLGRESEPQVYLPARQIPDGWMPLYDPKDLAVRASGPVEPLAAELRRIVARVDPKLPVTDVRTLDAVVAADTAPRATQLAVLAGFAAAALLLAGIGLHGLLAHTVSSRGREIGVRLALGATKGSVVALVLRHAFVPAGWGLAAGVLLAAAAGRALGALLFGVSPFDAATYAVATAALLVIAAVGAALPARRAAGLDPTTALRAE